MEQLGMNTLDYFITQNEKEVTHYLAKHMDDPISLRTERGTEYMCPFYYKIPGRDLVDKALGHLREGYKLILAPSLDTKNCLAFGTVALSEGAENVMEFVLEAGKVRELDSHPRKHTEVIPTMKMAAVMDKDYPGRAAMLNMIYKDVKDTCYDQSPCVVEWSYYSMPVGRLKRNLIYWELRPY